MPNSSADIAEFTSLTTEIQPQSQLPHAIDRPDIVELLSRPNGPRVTVISAPDGCGKNSTINNFIAQCSQSETICRLRLDAQHRSANNFFNQLRLAIEVKHPGFYGYCIPAPPRLDGRCDGPFVEIFVNQLQRLPATTIVVQGCELISAANWLPVIKQLVDRECNAHIRWLFSSSETQFLVNLKLILTTPLQVIHVRQLSFNKQQCSDFLIHNCSQQIPESTRYLMAEITRGVPANLKFIELALRTRCLTPEGLQQLALGYDGHQLKEHLIELLLDGLPLNVRTLLIKTAFLPRFCEPLCEFVLQRTSIDQEMLFLDRTEFIIERLDDSLLELRYHAIVRPMLVKRFKQLPEDERNELVGRACSWLAEHNCKLQAFEVASYYSSRALYLESVRQHLKHWLKTGNFNDLLLATGVNDPHNLFALQESKVAWLWMLVLAGQFRQADLLLKNLNQDWISDFPIEPGQNLKLILFVLKTLMDCMLGKPNHRHIEQIQKQYHEPHTNREVRICIDNLLAYQNTNNRRFISAMEHANRARGLADHGNDELGLAISSYTIARLHFLKNDIRGANQTCEHFFSRYSAKPGFSGWSLVAAVKIQLLYFDNQPKAAEKFAATIISQSSLGFNNEIQMALSLPLIRNSGKRKQYALATLLLDNLSEHAGKRGSVDLLAHISFERARIAFINGNKKALDSLEKTHLDAKKIEYLLNPDTEIDWSIREKWLLSHLLCLIHRRDYSQAKIICRSLTYLNVERGFPVRYLITVLFSGWIDFLQGNKFQAFKALNNVLLQAGASGSINGTLTEIPTVEVMIQAAYENGSIENPETIATLRQLNLIVS